MSSSIATVHTGALPGVTSESRHQLAVIEGPDVGRAVTLGPRPVTIGTSSECGLTLTDERVSRRHAAVAMRDGRFVVTDLGSTNGTWYEGSRVTEVEAASGAMLGVGRSFVRIQPESCPLEVPPSRARRFGELVGESLAMREVFAVLELAAARDVTVLLEGETGTGKELAARALHDEGPRRKRAFVAIDCGALPESLLESELFGHVKGAFTGAAQARAGAFVRADGGTLFLDELAGVPMSVQSRLLRVLEDRRVRAVGADREQSVDVRVVAASREDLQTAVTQGRFRADLYYRLSVLRVSLPPLRARREDLAMLVRELLVRRGFDGDGIDGPSLERLRGHDWPGNVRELRNVIDRALTMSPGAQSFRELKVSLDAGRSAPAEGEGVRVDLPFTDAKERCVAAFERHYLRALMDRCEGNLSEASRVADIDRKHLRALLRRHGLREG